MNLSVYFQHMNTGKVIQLTDPRNVETYRTAKLARVYWREIPAPVMLLPGLNDTLVAMRDYAAMVLDFEQADALAAFWEALAAFAASSWTCPGCGEEQPADTGCEMCERCAGCCTLSTNVDTPPTAGCEVCERCAGCCTCHDDSDVPCPDCGWHDCCCGDWRKARRLAAEFNADWFEDRRRL